MGLKQIKDILKYQTSYCIITRPAGLIIMCQFHLIKQISELGYNFMDGSTDPSPETNSGYL